MMSKFFRPILISILIWGCCGFGATFGQEKTASAKKKAAKDPRSIVSAWDKNQNGILEDSEIPAAAREKVRETARKQGLNPDKPLKIEKLFKKAGDAKKSRDKKNAEKKKASSDATVKKTESSRKSKAFGGKRRNAVDAEQVVKTQSMDKDKKGNERDKKALNLMARSMLYQHDKNKNGRLEKSEWGKLKGDVVKADRNRDGIITSSELKEHLAGYGSREEKFRPKKTARSKSWTPTKEGDRKSYRFLTPQERLPDGLPDWFTEKDGNQDGQISFREFTGRVTAASYDKFMRLDLNRDGFLVAKEYLKATE